MMICESLGVLFVFVFVGGVVCFLFVFVFFFFLLFFPLTCPLKHLLSVLTFFFNPNWIMQ